ncbi:MAG: hypothetical protein IKZ19_03490, partial [Clostridia bacterium]|nr:hypothetical protein [Clostridia bacterium]
YFFRPPKGRQGELLLIFVPLDFLSIKNYTQGKQGRSLPFFPKLSHSGKEAQFCSSKKRCRQRKTSLKIALPRLNPTDIYVQARKSSVRALVTNGIIISLCN